MTTSPLAHFRLRVTQLTLIAVALSFGIPYSASTASTSTDLTHFVSRTRLIESAVFYEIDSVRHRFALAHGHFTTAYQSAVVTSAREEIDPRVPLTGGVVVEFGIWGIIPSGSVATNATRIVDDWVNRDAWNGTDTFNRDCTAPTAPGCNSHRRAILSVTPYRGAHLYVDVGAVATDQHGFSGVSISALLIWESPPNAYQGLAPSAASSRLHDQSR